MNSFEYSARQAKVQILCRYLNSQFAYLGLDMTNQRDRYKAAEVVRSFSDLEWRQLAINVGKRPASDATRAAVVAEYTKTVAETGRLLNEAM